MLKKPMKTLDDLLMLKLKALYDIETQLTKAVPKMAKKATDNDLKAAFEKHAVETEGHVMRLEEIFVILEVKPATLKVDAIRGLVKDAEWAVKEKPPETALDAMLIASASYIEHYEMAGYIAAHRWAVRLGLERVADRLKMTLDEEVEAAKTLAEIAEEVDAKVM
jgi:ferritin-like metal-binding protein YciE